MDGLTIKNNIIYDGGSTYFAYISADCTTNIDVDDNLWYGTPASNWQYGATNCANLATWNGQAGVGTDIQADPLFVSAGTDFRIRAGSPARDAGTDVGLTSDYIGTTVPQNTTQDIGAYEYPHQTNILIRKVKEILTGLGIQL